jgi:hypothetical protein
MVKEADWVTERSDIVTQIFFAVGSTNHVSVTSPSGEFRGTILYPDAKGLVISADGELPELSPGAPLCVEHNGALDNYRFYTEVMSVERSMLRTIVPYAAQSTDRRAADRIALANDGGCYFRTTFSGGVRSFALNDLSPTGLSFLDVRDAGLMVGNNLQGELLLPYEAAIDIGIEVRHMNLRRGQLVVGARFTSLSMRNNVRLAQFLARWSQRASA